MNEQELNDLFLEYWKQSFPVAKPGVHAMNTHIGWALFLLNHINYNKQNQEQQR